MTRLAVATLAALLALAPGIGAVQTASQKGAPPQTPTFRSTADIVPLFVTVTGKDGRLVTDLTRDDFKIFDEGKAQPITLFDNTPQPIRLIALVDVSGSMRQNTPLVRRAVIELVRHLTPGDLARVGTFGNTIEISPTFTLDAQELVNWLPTQILEGPTPLWAAVDQAITEFEKGPPGRRVILVLSDGKDFPGMGQKFVSSITVADRAQKEDVMVYGIGLRGMIQPSGQGGAAGLTQSIVGSFVDPGLGQISDDTGGGYFELRGQMNFTETFAKVAEELHRQYLLGFAPPKRDGKKHDIEIKMKTSGQKPRVRKTYVAPKDK